MAGPILYIVRIFCWGVIYDRVKVPDVFNFSILSFSAELLILVGFV